MRNRVGGGRSGKVVLLLALFLGLVSAVLVYVYLSQTGGEESVASDTGATGPVVVASENIDPGTRITGDLVASPPPPMSWARSPASPSPPRSRCSGIG